MKQKDEECMSNFLVLKAESGKGGFDMNLEKKCDQITYLKREKKVCNYSLPFDCLVNISGVVYIIGCRGSFNVAGRTASGFQ